ncbi:Anti-sigma B factor antagonist RsbV [hydrothermal vent metagenome]|uniref:Anti-sigma B factor antagonist RsbV n=1 Tax=hydrothermal vent metagenome TaxID=652676 RepID=A0A3B1A4J6_9ZZZZ
MPISSTISDNGKTVTINVSGRFDFNSHRDFRASYGDEGGNLKYIVDMSGTNYMDSSALGMLLLLREHAGGDSCDVTITSCSEDIKKILTISNFEKLFKLS